MEAGCPMPEKDMKGQKEGMKPDESSPPSQ
jgi:hypothetical protein